MDNYFEKSDFYEMSEADRIQALDTNCEEKKTGYAYFKQLTDEQLKEKNSEISQALQEIEVLKEQRKELTKAISANYELISSTNKDVISKATEVRETVWTVIDLHSGYSEKINSEGYIIEKTRVKSGTTMNMFRNAEQQEQKVS